MNAEAPPPIADRTALDPEWARIDMLVSVAEAARSGVKLPEGFGARFDALSASVTARRNDGVWANLATLVPEAALASFIQLDLDLIALALAPHARPALAARIHALQPQIGAPQPSLALVQELLMLDDGESVATLYDRLEPGAPLVRHGLIKLAGSEAYQSLSVPAPVGRRLLGHGVDLSPPPGAHLMQTDASWDDLILPEAALSSLREYTAWIVHREAVIGEWSARALGGPLALFAGPSGSGKSFAASVITAALSQQTGAPWSLYTLDLGRIMSKYVGETEQNLNGLLDALDRRRAVLQIDEADGLLGKRGEVTDARDRYANLEVSHMLSRFERHAGPVILTTNLRSNIDAAFLRRFQKIVDFPAPDTAARRVLWERLLPRDAPRAETLDTGILASSARLSGGAIHNAAFFAAVLARDEGCPIGPDHIARAVWAELKKDTRQVRRSELGALADYLAEELA